MNESVTFRSPFMGIHHLESLPFGKWERFIFTTTVHQAKERVFFLKKACTYTAYTECPFLWTWLCTFVVNSVMLFINICIFVQFFFPVLIFKNGRAALHNSEALWILLIAKEGQRSGFQLCKIRFPSRGHGCPGVQPFLHTQISLSGVSFSNCISPARTSQFPFSLRLGNRLKKK